MKLISYISVFMIPVLILYILGYGLIAKRNIYNDFLEGAEEGLKIVWRLVPTLIGLMTAVGVLRVRFSSISGKHTFKGIGGA